MYKFKGVDKTRFIKGVVALIMGCVVYHFGDRLLGAQLELWRGLQTFSIAWAVDVFVLPFFVGLMVSAIFGFGGKWLSLLPPLIVRLISYYEILYITGAPQGATLMPMGYWGFTVILTVEFSQMGGILGEVMMKGTYGRSPRHKIYKEKASASQSDPEA
jgi:hypothetical protein